MDGERLDLRRAWSRLPEAQPGYVSALMAALPVTAFAVLDETTSWSTVLSWTPVVWAAAPAVVLLLRHTGGRRLAVVSTVALLPTIAVTPVLLEDSPWQLLMAAWVLSFLL